MKKKGTLSLSLQSKPDPAVPEWQNNAIPGKQKIPVIFVIFGLVPIQPKV